jgi:hypothetical protein
MTPRLILALMMSLVAFTHVGSAQLPNLNEIMRQKLEHGQGLLEAVVLGQHVAVERYAYELTLLSEATTWTPLRTPEFLRYASRFRDSADSLMEEAQNENMERVAFAYTELVTTCVQCHRHVRGAQAAE